MFLVILTVISIFIISCKNNTSEPSPPHPADNYFINKNETSYKFNIQVFDSTGLLFSGLRRTDYNDEIILDGVTYQIAIDTFHIDRSN
ncbi:MAG: hypothetical protein Q8M94_14505, partial [Ignavibacteria bacterium]|nr:hypothetical protein [Ignavibacteria bacterium]